MRSYFWKYFTIFLILALLQILFFNNLILRIGHWFFVPEVYILLFLLLPYDTKNFSLLTTGFVVGLIIDLIDGSLALHTASSVMAIFLRPLILTMVSPQLGYTQGIPLSYQNYGWIWFIKYSTVFVFIHHLTYYLLNNFNLAHLPVILLQSVINTIYTMIFIVITHYFIKNRPLNA